MYIGAWGSFKIKNDEKINFYFNDDGRVGFCNRDGDGRK